MTELADPGNKDKTEHVVFFFDHRIERFQCPQKFHTVFMGYVVENWFVILIQQYNHIAVPVMQSFDQFMEHGIRRCGLQCYIIDFRLFQKYLPETVFHFFQ